MGGECSQKLRPWRGMTLLSGAQQTSGSVENQHSTSKSLALRPEDRLRIYFFFPLRAVRVVMTAASFFRNQCCGC
jgi:hypothetical protein